MHATVSFNSNKVRGQQREAPLVTVLLVSTGRHLSTSRPPSSLMQIYSCNQSKNPLKSHIAIEEMFR
jgi:hypothetical protein